ncbi:MAG: hypothetical protein QOC64_713, partial [Solirubrobacteraceae bacterium]|nr:hypothetical protein [Solirubrobacteraceae bacterium]
MEAGAQRAIEAVLETLAERLAGGEVDDLAAARKELSDLLSQLPRGCYEALLERLPGF